MDRPKNNGLLTCGIYKNISSGGFQFYLYPLQEMISGKDKDLIRQCALQADLTSRLQPAQLEVVHRNGWLQMLAPASIGGGEWDLPSVIRLEEELAEVDGSTAWVVTLCAGAAWFTGFISSPAATEILSTPLLCIAGSGANGIAIVEEEQYILSGEWAHASGAPWATHFTANAQVKKNEELVLNPDGSPYIKSFIVPRDGVQLIESWETTGMRATASKRYAITDCKIRADHTFEILAKNAVAEGPLYQFPFMALAELTLAANLSGITSNFLVLAQAAIEQRKEPRTGQSLAEFESVSYLMADAYKNLQEHRNIFYSTLDTAWAKVMADAKLTNDMKVQITVDSLNLVSQCRHIVNSIYPYCGLRAAMQGNLLNLAWRDFQTASQHSLLLSYKA